MSQILALINEMSPYLLLGFFLAGLMHVYIPSGFYTKYLSARDFRSVLLAALFGVPLPLCSCGVLPTAMSLRKEGASHGATVSFLIATPQTGIDSIIATYSLMGLPFAIVRPVVAFLTAIGGGWIVNRMSLQTFHNPQTLPQPLPTGRGVDTSAGEETCNGNKDDYSHGEHTHSHEAPSCSCGHCHSASHSTPRPVGRGWGRVLSYAFLEMMEDIGKWLVVGLVVAGLITVFVPDTFFAVFKDNSLLSMLLVLAIAIPMYICATGSIPIAVALMMKGLTPGAGLVLLMAGPACNVASMLVVRRVLGRRTLVTYLASIIVGSIGFGLLIDHLLPRSWFTPTLISSSVCCGEPHTDWLGWTCTAILALLLVNAFVHSRLHGPHHPHHRHSEVDADDALVLHVTGMTCSHCAANARKVLLAVPGVTAVEVSHADGTARITGTASREALVAALAGIGFKAEV